MSNPFKVKVEREEDEEVRSGLQVEVGGKSVECSNVLLMPVS